MTVIRGEDFVNDDFSMETARHLAAKAWCNPATSNKDMDPDLAEAFAKLLHTYCKLADPRLVNGFNE